MKMNKTAIGTTKPLIIFGASAGISWKGFDLSATVQAVNNRDIYLSGNSYWAFQNNGTGQAFAENLNRWTVNNTTTATYPRLSYGTNINNQAVSSYWIKNGNYLRLKILRSGMLFRRE